MQICESSTKIKQYNDFHKKNFKNIFMLCNLILYSLNNVIQYYILFFLELRNTYNILSARSAAKKSSSLKSILSSFFIN